jgi:tRNA(fMet)-specific endonuclease VapC
MRYLLGTNIVFRSCSQPSRKVAQRIRKLGEGNVSPSIDLAAELRYGAEKRARPDSQLNWKL